MTSTSSESSTPDASAFPFADLLADLRQRGLGIGLNEYKDIATLLSRWKGSDRVTFRNAFAAVLARNADEVVHIRKVFDEWADAKPPEPKPEPIPARKIRTWHVVAVVLLVVSGAAVGAWVDIDRHRVRTVFVDVSPPPAVTDTTTTYEPPTKPEPALPDPPHEPSRQRPWVALAVAVAVAWVVLGVRRTRSQQRKWARSYWRHALAEEPGPQYYEQNVVSAAPFFPRSEIEELATILGRAMETEPAEDGELDVEESLRRTLRAGLAPHLVFQPPPRNVPVLVLQDISWHMRPWQQKVDSLVRELQRQGVMLERWYFDGDPLHVSRTSHGHSMDLEAFALLRPDASLMVVSSGQRIEARSMLTLDRLLKNWQFRTWINPIGNREYWRKDLAALEEIRLWPMTNAGVRAAAVEISRRGDAGVAPIALSPPVVTPGDVEQMRRLMALVPNPSLALAEELRKRFALDVPEDVLLFLGAEGVFFGDSIPVPPADLKRLIEASSIDPERERNVRRYLLDVLHDSKPPEDSAAFLRWQLDEAIQRVKLGDASAEKTLRDLADGPLREEVQIALDTNAVPIRVDALPPGTLPVPPPESLGKRPPLWRWPRWIHAAIALLVLAPLGWVTRETGIIGTDVVPHQRGVYSLHLDEYENVVAEAAPAGMPTRVKLYKDGVNYFGESLDLSRRLTFGLSNEVRGVWWDLRGELRDGSLATSYPLWIPRRMRYQASPDSDWRKDELTEKVVSSIAAHARVDPSRITPTTYLSYLGVRDDRAAADLVTKVSGDFGVTAPVSDGAHFKLVVDVVDYVRSARAGGPVFVRLTFVTPSGAAIDGAPYSLARPGSRIAGVGGRAMMVTPGTYNVSVASGSAVRSVGTIEVLPAQLFTRQFVLSPWTDAFSLRVVRLIAKDLGVSEARLTPNVTLRDLGANSVEEIGVLAGIKEEFFGVTESDPFVDPSRLRTVGAIVDYTRELVNAQNRRVPVTLTFTSPSGVSRGPLSFTLTNAAGVLTGRGGLPFSARPGIYTLLVIVPARIQGGSLTADVPLGTIEVLIGKPFEKSFVVSSPDAAPSPAARAPVPAPAPLRTLGVADAGDRPYETWTERSDRTWLVTWGTPVQQITLKVVAIQVEGLSFPGTFTELEDEKGMHFLVPESGSDTVWVRLRSGWTNHGKVVPSR